MSLFELISYLFANGVHARPALLGKYAFIGEVLTVVAQQVIAALTHSGERIGDDLLVGALFAFLLAGKHAHLKKALAA